MVELLLNCVMKVAIVAPEVVMSPQCLHNVFSDGMSEQDLELIMSPPHTCLVNVSNTKPRIITSVQLLTCK